MTTLAPRKPVKTAAEKHAASIAAATLAAQTFNASRVSLFDTARVTGLALKTALQSMAERTLATVPGVSLSSSVRVIYGTAACCQHRWEGNDRHGMRVIHAVIMLPDFDDVANVPRAFADELCAYTLHELAHAIFTEPNDFARGIGQLARKHSVSHDAAKGVFNSIEDVRIERALLASGYAAGFRGVIRTLAARTVMQAKEAGCMLSFARGDKTAWAFAFAFGARGYAPGAEGFRAALTQGQQRIYDSTAAALLNVAADAHGTAATLQIADAALTALALEPEPMGPQGQPCDDGEPGDEPQPGDEPGEPQQGEAGEPGDDGEPQDATEPGQNGPQGDAADSDDATDADDKGDDASDAQDGDDKGDSDDATDGEGQPGDDAADAGDEPTDAQGDGDAAGQPTDAPQGDDSDDATDGDSNTSTATANPQGVDPQPGAFENTEMLPRDTPESCAPQGGISTTNPPRYIRPTITEEMRTEGTSMLTHAREKFTKAGVLQSNLRRMFTRTDRDMMDSGLRAGRIRVGALPRVATGSENIFGRRTLADGLSSAVTILLDGSESMQRRTRMANRTVALLTQALATCNGVRTSVQVFQEGYANNPLNSLAGGVYSDVMGSSMDYQDVRITVLKDFDDAPTQAYANLSKSYAANCTPDLEAVHAVGGALALRAEPRKVLICLVDGGSNRDALMAKEIAALKRRGVLTIAVGVQYDPKGYDYSVAVHSLNDLGGAAMRTLCDAVAREAEKAAQ